MFYEKDIYIKKNRLTDRTTSTKNDNTVEEFHIFNCNMAKEKKLLALKLNLIKKNISAATFEQQELTPPVVIDKTIYF